MMKQEHSGMNRRHFVTASATTVAGILLANATPGFAFTRSL